MKLIKIILITIPFVCSNLLGQIKNLKTHSQMTIDCKQCHICDTPTKADPCLVLCPRYKIEEVRHSPEEGPNEIILTEIKVENDLYQPVKFTHRLHSEMSLMSGGCSSCHHFNPPGKIVKCITCHEPERNNQDISKPDLKGAFHRQCMGCHATWEEKVDCKGCHKLNSEKVTEVDTVKNLENVHPKFIIPTRIVYETDYDEGKIVTYFHNDHTSLYGLECSDCHSQVSCVNCHNKKEKFATQDDGDIHDKCSQCHDTDDNCNVCHKDEISQPFNHETKTGFALKAFHAITDCEKCHQTKNEFTGLKKDCLFCHKNKDGMFNHTITGVNLDETHVELECEDCHKNRNFYVKPVCVDCHDEKSFPKDVPGERTK